MPKVTGLRRRLTEVIDARDSTIRFLDGHDSALLGMFIDESGEWYNAVYSIELIINNLRSPGMCVPTMTEAEATEFFCHNIEGSKFSGSCPLYVETWCD